MDTNILLFRFVVDDGDGDDVDELTKIVFDRVSPYFFGEFFVSTL